MIKLEKQISEWVEKKLIDAKTGKKILQYETTKSESSWALSSLLILGIIIICLGVISNIAFNWDLIPDFIKLSVDFIVLMVCGLFTLRAFYRKKELQFEILSLLFILLCLASIGLISQIYQTGGEFYQALMLWSLITAPLMLCTQYKIVPFIWMGGFLIGLNFTLLNSPFFYAMDSSQNITALFMMTPLLIFVFASISQKKLGESGHARAFQYWLILMGLIAIVYNEMFQIPLLTQSIYSIQMLAYLLVPLAIYFIVRHIEWRNTQKILLLLILLFFIIDFHIPGIRNIFIDLTYSSVTILILGTTAIFMASIKQRRVFQFLIFLIGVRFLVIYFQAFGSLALTGIGLIISGVILVGLAILWNKYRVQLANWAERWAS